MTKRTFYSEQEIGDALNALKKWRDTPDDYPFVVGAVLPILYAYEREMAARHIGWKVALWGIMYVWLWRFSFGYRDAFGRAHQWEARLKLLGIHIAVVSVIVSLWLLFQWAAQ